MTKNISEEELLLRKRARRRLLGAITLVIAAVVILPMIFDKPKQEQQYAVDIHIPSEAATREADSASINSGISSDELPVTDSAEAIDLIEQLPIESSDLSQKSEYFSDTMNGQNQIPIPRSKPQPDEIKNITDRIVEDNEVIATKSEFVVQLGAFSDHLKAKRQQQNVLSNGISAYTETRSIDNNEITRVRIGPFPTRNAAEDQLNKLKKLGLNGVVTVK
tara:strand:+ start:1034 stop:1693 length:660 start_codon:yes stop_codon:yes gene_type:complete